MQSNMLSESIKKKGTRLNWRCTNKGKEETREEEEEEKEEEKSLKCDRNC